MNSKYSPKTLADKAEGLLDLAVDTSFKELNYALDALKHAEGWDVPHGLIYAAEGVEGYIDILGKVWDKIPGWLVAMTRNSGFIAGKIGSAAFQEIKQRVLDELRDQYQDSVRDYYKTYTDRIATHVKPYPALWETTLAEVRKVSTPLGNASMSFDVKSGQLPLGELQGSINASLLDANDAIGEWEGAFAEALNYDYLNRLTTDVLPADNMVVHGLTAYATAMSNLATNKRLELSEIVDGVEDALNALKAGDLADDLNKTLFVLSTATSLVGGPAGMAFDLLLTIPEQIVVEEPKLSDINFASACPAHVIAKLGSALTELKENYQTQLDVIASAMGEAAAAITGEVDAAIKENRLGALTLPVPELTARSGEELAGPQNLVPD